MAGVTPQVAGACAVWIDSGGGLAYLGMTANGAKIDSQLVNTPIYTDQNGGESGLPADMQNWGEFHKVHLELTKWDPAVAAGVLALVQGGIAGTVPSTIGLPMSLAGLTFRLLLLPTIQPVNYPRAVLADSYELNKGTKHSTLVLNWECHAFASGTVYNSVTT